LVLLFNKAQQSGFVIYARRNACRLHLVYGEGRVTLGHSFRHKIIQTIREDSMTYIAAENRYDVVPYRRVGRSGLVLPALSLGLWHNFGDSTPVETQRAMLRTAFDHGINHFDLANNYGPPYGSAETNFGRLLKEDFQQYRDELIISTKAGWDMWPGPYGQRLTQIRAGKSRSEPAAHGPGLRRHLLFPPFRP
jgi:hypothetical protein